MLVHHRCPPINTCKRPAVTRYKYINEKMITECRQICIATSLFYYPIITFLLFNIYT